MAKDMFGIGDDYRVQLDEYRRRRAEESGDGLPSVRGEKIYDPEKLDSRSREMVFDRRYTKMFDGDATDPRNIETDEEYRKLDDGDKAAVHYGIRTGSAEKGMKGLSFDDVYESQRREDAMKARYNEIKGNKDYAPLFDSKADSESFRDGDTLETGVKVSQDDIDAAKWGMSQEKSRSKTVGGLKPKSESVYGEDGPYEVMDKKNK